LVHGASHKRVFRFPQISFGLRVYPLVHGRLGHTHVKVTPHPLRHSLQRHTVLGDRGNRFLLGPLREAPSLLDRIQLGRDACFATLVATFAQFAVDLQHGGLLQIDVLRMNVVRALALGWSTAVWTRRLAAVGRDDHDPHRRRKPDALPTWDPISAVPSSSSTGFSRRQTIAPCRAVADAT
jgi:hypothetical protein